MPEAPEMTFLRPLALTAVMALLVMALAGCSNPLKEETTESYAQLGFTGADATGRDRAKWPDLHGAKVTILDHGAFDWAFGPAKEAFEHLTNGTVEHIPAADAGDMVNQLLAGKKKPIADVAYGIDNAYYYRAVQADVLEPYKPLLAGRIDPQHLFDHDGPTWFATPVDFGYIAVNVDPDAGLGIQNLDDLRQHADKFVTQDPTQSSPGMGFLLATIATYGEGGVYSWQQYWRDLVSRGVTIEPDWTTAYANRFSAGYNSPDFAETGAGMGDKPIVTSYTTSPAYEVYYGRSEAQAAYNILEPESTFKQVQTMAIVKGSKNRVAAEAWIEFTLTDAFQELAAEYNAIYPIVRDPTPQVAAARIFQGVDPEPGSFQPADLDVHTIGANLERWLCEWTAIREKDSAGFAACR